MFPLEADRYLKETPISLFPDGRIVIPLENYELSISHIETAETIKKLDLYIYGKFYDITTAATWDHQHVILQFEDGNVEIYIKRFVGSSVNQIIVLNTNDVIIICEKETQVWDFTLEPPKHILTHQSRVITCLLLPDSKLFLVLKMIVV